jgi:hypothetical protein
MAPMVASSHWIRVWIIKNSSYGFVSIDLILHITGSGNSKIEEAFVHNVIGIQTGVAVIFLVRQRG